MKKTNKSLLDKVVDIKSRGSIYHGEWGIVIDECPEDNEYIVAIAGSKTSHPVFGREELKVSKDQTYAVAK